jgi:hypothetical protein
MPQAAKFSKKLRTKEGFKNIFEQQERTLFSLDTDDKGLCLFAYKNKTNKTLCSLHSVALDSGLQPHKVKPISCTLWPLALSESRPYLLSIDDEAFSFGCNKKRKGSPKKLDPNISDIINALFGPSFLRSIETHRENE